MSVRRDPETGQFVSGRQVAVGEYEDLVVQSAILGHSTVAGQQSGGTEIFISEGEEDNSVEVLEGDVHATERAELVAISGYYALSLPVTATSESHGEAILELSEDAESTFVDDRFTDTTTVTSSGGDSDVQRNTQIESGTLDTAILMAEAGNRDTTNGTAAGADHAMREVFRHFPAFGGTGPMFDQDDRIYLHSRLTTNGVSDHGIRLRVGLVLWWAIHERS